MLDIFTDLFVFESFLFVRGLICKRSAPIGLNYYVKMNVIGLLQYQYESDIVTLLYLSKLFKVTQISLLLPFV
jgi:hypothetical protein